MLGVKSTLQRGPFFYTGQIYYAFKSLIKEQICQKLITINLFKGRATQSKIRSTMKWWWWSECLSMLIVKTTIRNVPFKVSKMGKLMLAAQSDVLVLVLVLTHEAPGIVSFVSCWWSRGCIFMIRTTRLILIRLAFNSVNCWPLLLIYQY